MMRAAIPRRAGRGENLIHIIVKGAIPDPGLIVFGLTEILAKAFVADLGD
jgi:hypothetical protein